MTNGFLVDTNAVSEMSRREPHPVVAQLYSDRRHDLFISVITLGELRRGEARLRGRDPIRAAQINTWLEAVERDLAHRVLPIGADIAHCWGEISSQRSRPLADALIAATALVHGLTLVTRNIRDFEGLDLQIFNPWKP